MRELAREDLVTKLEEIEFWPELKPELDHYLNHYVHDLDTPMVELLLSAGANSNPKARSDCFLHHLMHEYSVNKTTKGQKILELVELLLSSGANPNRVWGNNLRAYDYALGRDMQFFVDLLEKYGANTNPREPI